jgi:hypothetical protein
MGKEFEMMQASLNAQSQRKGASKLQRAVLGKAALASLLWVSVRSSCPSGEASSRRPPSALSASAAAAGSFSGRGSRSKAHASPCRE